MGVPKFFRWLLERYPCLCEVVREYEIPEFDNLYLDMNGIIHICSHPNDFDPHFRITEEKIFKDIFHYVEILFRMIQPQKLFFMAVDGVAPRAKLNQQRGRRFRTAKEAVELEKRAVDCGAELPKEKRFDSNCITPGTEFMERLHHQLRYFIADKMTNDKLWKNVKVILSGHETPGEGEHKIMDYIRYMKSQPDYDHNTRHCLYGLDADLIMLGLCTHEPHFSLLREEVKYGKKAKRMTMPEDTKFYLLHLSLLRDYLDWEFSSLKDKLPFGYNIENIIDDWVMMGFLVGNDFIPHLPGLHISHGALQMLHKAYMDVLPTLDGYINEGGTLVLSRFQCYMEKLAAFDMHQFKDEYADLKYFEGKTGRRMGANKERPKFFNNPDTGSPEESIEAKSKRDPKLQEMIMYTEKVGLELEALSVSGENKEEDLEQLFGAFEDDFHEEDEDDDDEDDESMGAVICQEFHQKKRDYYTNKLEFETVTPEVLQSQAEGYVRAIQWNLHYYYNGVCSWSWFYPHHYAPYISDIKNFCDLDIQFDIGKPFLPFQQLLAVLPSLSKSLLPEAYHSLMENENSPIIDYYPSTFQTDLNGKRQEWEAVVLIPFIDECRLLKAMTPLEGCITEEERRRNRHGPMLVFTYSGKSVGSFEAPYFPKIESNHALEKRMMSDDIAVPKEKLVKGLCSNVLLDVHVPGFPTFCHVPHKAQLKKAKVKVFESPTRSESMILEILTDEILFLKEDTDVIAKELLGHTYHVYWPHLFETKIIEVIDSSNTYSLAPAPCKKVKEESSAEESDNGDSDGGLNIVATAEDRWKLEVQSIREEYEMHLGVQLGPVSVVVRALPMSGRKYAFSSSGAVSLEKQWNNIPKSFALQTVVKNLKVMEPKRPECKTIHEMFPPKTTVFLLGNPYYGSMGKVTNIIPANAEKVARVKIAVRAVLEPDMENVKAHLIHSGVQYYPGVVAARRVGISGHLLSRVTGTMYISQNDSDPDAKAVNVGLNLKFNKRNEEVPGFTKKDNNTWLYSDRCIELLANYIRTFPDLFAYLCEHTETNDFQEVAIFPENTKDGARLKDVTEWLSQQAHVHVEHRKCGMEVLEADVVLEIEKEVERIADQVKKERKTLTIVMQPHLIYKPGFKMGYMQPDPEAEYLLYDRVVNVRECFTVPLGLRGTVVGIQRAARQENTLYDIVFDAAFEGGASVAGCSHGKGYRLPGYALINLSHGARCKKGVDSLAAHVAAAKSHPLSAVSILPSGNILIRHPNRAVASTFGGNRGTAHHAGRMPDRPASAFASWSTSGVIAANHPAAVNFQANDQSGGTCNHQNPSPKMDSALKGKEPVILRRQAPEQQQQEMQHLASQPASTTQLQSCSAEFQAMWKELQKSGGSVSIAKTTDEIKPNPPLPFMLNTNQLPAAVIASSTVQAKDPKTDFLKKILRIDEAASSPSMVTLFPTSPTVPSQKSVTSPLQEISQPSVQDFFERAKAASAQQQERNKKAPASYCLQLISMFQRTGQGTPRYDYVVMKNGLMRANLTLPNGFTIQGEPGQTMEKASENVAEIALSQMALWSKHDTQYGSFPMPANKLPAPPQQWYQHHQSASIPQQQQQNFNPFANQSSWPTGNIYQKLNWREHAEQSSEWRRQHNPNQWQGIRPPPPPSQPPFSAHRYPQPGPPFSFNLPFHQYQRQQQPNAHPQWNCGAVGAAASPGQPLWRPPVPQGPTSASTKPPVDSAIFPGANGAMTTINPFIPLQAVRAQMNANSDHLAQQLPQKQSPKKHQPPKEAKKSNESKAKAAASSSGGSNSVQKNASGKAVSHGKHSGNQVDSGVGGEKAVVGSGVATVEGRLGEQRRGSKGEGQGRERESKALYVPPHARKSRLAIKFRVDEP